MNIEDLEITDFCPFCQNKLISATTGEFHCNKCRYYRTVLDNFIELQNENVFIYISRIGTILYHPIEFGNPLYVHDVGIEISNVFIEHAKDIHDVLKRANKIWNLKTLA